MIKRIYDSITYSVDIRVPSINQLFSSEKNHNYRSFVKTLNVLKLINGHDGKNWQSFGFSGITYLQIGYLTLNCLKKSTMTKV